MRTENGSYVKFGVYQRKDGQYIGYVGGIDRSGWEPESWTVFMPTKTHSKGKALLEAKQYFEEWKKIF